MDPVLECVEHLVAVRVENHELSVQDVLALWEVELWEVAVERLAAAALDEDILAVDEGKGAKSIPLRLIGPTLALGEGLSRQRELRLYRRLERKQSSARYS
jgi:hypothetical protein